MNTNSRPQQTQTTSKMPINDKNNVVDYCTTQVFQWIDGRGYIEIPKVGNN